MLLEKFIKAEQKLLTTPQGIQQQRKSLWEVARLQEKNVKMVCLGRQAVKDSFAETFIFQRGNELSERCLCPVMSGRRMEEG